MPGAGHHHPGGQGLHVHEDPLAGRGCGQVRHLAAVADRHRLRAGQRHPQDPDPAAAPGQGRDRPDPDRPRSWPEPHGRLHPRPGLQQARPAGTRRRRRRRPQSLLRRDPGPECRRSPAGLPRPFRRRPADHRAGNGLRRPLWPQPVPRCPGRRQLRAGRRAVQRRAGRGDPGSPGRDPGSAGAVQCRRPRRLRGGDRPAGQRRQRRHQLQRRSGVRW
ncbi:hypothetical protein D3C85_1088380 [compost metagenome]